MYTKSNQSESMLAAGLLSVFGSFIMIISYVLFPKIRKYSYLKTVFYVAINDFIASIGVSLGDVNNGTFACYFQSFTTGYNILVSVFLTSAITYELYIIVSTNAIFPVDARRRLHIFCWIFPLIVSLLPFTTNTLGQPDDDAGWCFIGNRKGSPPWGIELWSILAFYAWLWVCIFVTAFYFTRVLYLLRLKNTYETSRSVAAALRTLAWYPIVLVICWGMSSIYDIYTIFVSVDSLKDSSILDAIAVVTASLQGFFHFIIFGFVNRTVYNCWVGLLCCKSNLDSDPLLEDGQVSKNQISVDSAAPSYMGAGVGAYFMSFVQNTDTSNITTSSTSAFNESFTSEGRETGGDIALFLVNRDTYGGRDSISTGGIGGGNVSNVGSDSIC